MSRKIAVKIRQGGSGKTTTSVNLATALSILGKRVLLVDVDSQANSTQSVGIHIKEGQKTLCDLLSSSGIACNQVIIKTNFGIDIIPSYYTLSQIEMNMSLSKLGELKKILMEVDNDYDFMVIDTPPSESFLVIASLVASDEVVIPVETQFLPMFGLQKAIMEINQIKSGLNPNIKISGILATKVEGYTNLSKAIIAEIKKTYPDLLFPMVIPKSVKVAESPSKGRPIVLTDKNHPVSISYMALAKLLIDKI